MRSHDEHFSGSDVAAILLAMILLLAPLLMAALPGAQQANGGIGWQSAGGGMTLPAAAR